MLVPAPNQPSVFAVPSPAGATPARQVIERDAPPPLARRAVRQPGAGGGRLASAAPSVVDDDEDRPLGDPVADYAVLYLGGRWLKASPAFNRELCERVGVAPLDFDGSGDALLHPFDGTGGRYMEYVRDHGTFDDLPLQRILDTYARAYPGLAMGPSDRRPT